MPSILPGCAMKIWIWMNHSFPLPACKCVCVLARACVHTPHMCTGEYKCVCLWDVALGWMMVCYSVNSKKIQKSAQCLPPSPLCVQHSRHLSHVKYVMLHLLQKSLSCCNLPKKCSSETCQKAPSSPTHFSDSTTPTTVRVPRLLRMVVQVHSGKVSRAYSTHSPLNFFHHMVDCSPWIAYSENSAFASLSFFFNLKFLPQQENVVISLVYEKAYISSQHILLAV